MRGYKKNIWAVAVLAIMGFASSCIKNETCLSANNLLLTEMWTVNDEGNKVPANIDSLSLFIVGREDSVLYDNVKDIGSFSIPLSDTDTSFVAVLNLNDGIDTIWIDYRSYSVFRSTECGVINRYEINDLNYTKNKVWGMELYNNQVDESGEVNILLVFRTN